MGTGVVRLDAHLDGHPQARGRRYRLLLIALAFVADLGAAAMVVSVLLGALLIAIAFGGWREGDSLPATTHQAIDRFVACGIGLAALVAMLTGRVAGAAVLALLAASLGALIYFTRYRGERPQPATTATWDNRSRDSARG
jgi:hypothetical protein